MALNNIMEKLKLFLGLSEEKQIEKHDKLLKIINKLESKRLRLKLEIQKKKRKTGSAPKKLCREYKVVTKLLKKAKKHAAAITDQL